MKNGVFYFTFFHSRDIQVFVEKLMMSYTVILYFQAYLIINFCVSFKSDRLYSKIFGSLQKGTGNESIAMATS